MSAGPRRRRVPGCAAGHTWEFFASLREVSARGLLDLAGVRSGLIGKRSRSRASVREPQDRKTFHAAPAPRAALERSRSCRWLLIERGKTSESVRQLRGFFARSPV